MGLVYLDLLIVHIISGRINCTGLFLDHSYGVTHSATFLEECWIVEFIIFPCSEVSGYWEILS